MAVRDFPDGAGITLAPGNAATAANGAWTIAVITKPMALNTFRVVVAVGNGITDLALWTTSSGGVQAVVNGFDAPIALPLVENEWFLIAITKTSGVATPRGHAYRYSTGTWTHLDSANTLEGKAGSVSLIELGRTNNDWFYVGYIAVAGVWTTALSDTQIETLETDLQAWLDTGAVAVWPLNQESVATPVVDITGGGANQTAQSGTAVVLGDDPPGFNFELGGGGPVTVPVNVATETSSAFAVAKRKTKIVTNSIENSTASPVGRRKQRTVGLAVETSSVNTLDVRKQRAVGLATETNTAFLVTSSAIKFIPVGTTVETSTAFVLARSKTYQVNATQETDVAFPVAFSQGFSLGVAVDNNITFPVTKHKVKSLGLATETDVAFSIREPGRLGLATETEFAFPITPYKLRVVSGAVETGQAFGLSKTKVKTLGRTTEFNVSIFITTPEHVVGPFDIGVFLDNKTEVRADLHINVDVSVPKIVSEIRRHLSTSQ